VTWTEHGISVSAAQGLPVWTENRRSNIQAVVADEEIAAMNERLRLIESRTDAVSRSEARMLTRRLKKAQSRRERILKWLPVDMRDRPGELARLN
jgi:hypothetical protein